MKISNSKKELARIISENGGWQEHCEWAVQDKSGEFGESSVILFDGKDKPIIEAGMSEWMCAQGYESDSTFGKHVCDADKLVKNWHQTILSRAEYFHLYPAPDADGWIEYNGEGSPYSDEVVVEAKWSDGDFTCSDNFGPGCAWIVNDGEPNITHHRLHKPEQASETETLSANAVSGANDALMSESIEMLVRNPTIEQLSADYRNAKDCAERKQRDADDAKSDVDAKLKALELAGEALGLLVSPITEKQEPEPATTVQVGDEVECVDSNIKRDKYNGMVGRLHTIDESDTSTPYLVDFCGDEKIWCHEVKFIRRP